MHIEPALPDFHGVTIRRSGGIMGMDQTLTIGEDLNAKVICSRTGEHAFALDAFTAQELMQALATFAAERPTASTARGADMFNYDIELSWNGSTYRVRSVDVGADDALHGVMFAANRLMNERDEQPVHVMQLHDARPEAPDAATAPNGNDGIVPPWLR